jgi:hypothetical protein
MKFNVVLLAMLLSCCLDLRQSKLFLTWVGLVSLWKNCLPPVIESATLLEDERLLDKFIFLMEMHWRDLQKLIDQQMMKFNNQGSPFH